MTGTELVPVETVEIKPLALTKWSHHGSQVIFSSYWSTLLILSSHWSASSDLEHRGDSEGELGSRVSQQSDSVQLPRSALTLQL